MKRRGYVVEEVASLDNLRFAFVKARRGKSCKHEVLRFAANLDNNLLRLRQQISDGRVEVGNYHYFTIRDPKLRTICAAPFGQRVLHHALMNVCHDDFERCQTGDSYASRVGRGTYAALDTAYSNQCRCRYWLKLDIRKYFDSVSHGVLWRQLCRMYKDERLLGIFFQIIDSYSTAPGRGLPIGNLTSQYFANHYLGGLDHYVRETLHAQGYVRYMDDMMLWHNDRATLAAMGKAVEEYVNEILQLRLKVMMLRPSSTFATFLGYKIARGRKSLSTRSAVRYRRLRSLYAAYDGGYIDQDEMRRHLHPLIAFADKVPSAAVKRVAMASIYGTA